MLDSKDVLDLFKSRSSVVTPDMEAEINRAGKIMYLHICLDTMFLVQCITSWTGNIVIPPILLESFLSTYSELMSFLIDIFFSESSDAEGEGDRQRQPASGQALRPP